MSKFVREVVHITRGQSVSRIKKKKTIRYNWNSSKGPVKVASHNAYVQGGACFRNDANVLEKC